MKVGIDARFVGPEGTGLGKYTEKLIENLVKIDTKNQYVVFLRQNNWSYLNLQTKNFTKVLADVPWYSFGEQLKMSGIYKAQNLDILHVPHFNVPILYNRPFIVTIHDLIHHKFSQESATTKNPLVFKVKRIAYRRIITNAVLKSKKIITPSNYVKNEILKNFKTDPAKITVTYEAAEEEYFQTSEIRRQKSEVEYILYVGNTYPHKNISILLDALNILKLKIKNLKLIIVCPRDVFKERLEKEIDDKNLKNKVEALPYQNAHKLTGIFAKAKAYVFPSLEEGFGIPGLNAMAAGLPLVSSNIPTLKEIYQDAALYFDPENHKDMAKKIQNVLKDQELRKDLITKGRKQAKKYSWLKMANQTLKVYKYLNL